MVSAIKKAICVLLSFCMVISIGMDFRVVASQSTLYRSSIRITAEREDTAGLFLDSGFYIHSDRPISIDDIDSIQIIPSTYFTLEERSPYLIYVDISETLLPHTVYNVRLMIDGALASAAFQTRERFRVTWMSPAANRNNVPVNVGIELGFSLPVNAEAILPYFTISPHVGGRFEQIDPLMVVFIPSDQLEHDMTYAVSLNEAFAALSGDIFMGGLEFQFTTQPYFIPGSVRHTFSHHRNITETFLTDDPITIRLSASNALENREVSVRLYRFAYLDEYMDAGNRRMQTQSHIDTHGLEFISEFEQRLVMNRDMFWNMGFLPLPQNPGEGLYLVDMNICMAEYGGDNLRAQKLIQVTDISVYSQTIGGEVLFWLNDAKTGLPIYGADITVTLPLLPGTAHDDAPPVTYVGISDQSGIALINTSHEQNRWGSYTIDVRITHENRSFGDFLPLFGRPLPAPSELFYTYVYIDRAAYQPTDTVHFWGIIAPRIYDTAVPETITLAWTDGGAHPDGMAIEIGANGVFTGSVSFINHTSTWERLRFEIDGEHLVTVSFSIMEYVKPIYTITIEPDRHFYRVGDNVELTTTVKFFDGTPAAGVDVAVAGQTVFTGDDGVAVSSIPVSRPANWRPTFEWLTVNVGSLEDRTVLRSISYRLFPRDYIMEAGMVTSNDNIYLVIDTHAIDFENVQEFERTRQLYTLRGNKAEMTGTVVLTEVYFIPERIGEFYCLIHRRVINRYRHNRVERVVWRQDIRTYDGHITLELPIDASDTSRSHFVTLNLFAPDGTAFQQTLNAPGFVGWIRPAEVQTRYRFNFPDISSIGEEIEVTVTNQDDIKPAIGRILYTVLGDGHLHVGVTDASSFFLTFAADYVPNVAVVGAFFTGRHIFVISPLIWDWHSSTIWAYRTEDSRLTVNISADNERYMPGDLVTVEIQITDIHGDGVPASFILSVVDEAAFSVMDQWVNPLERLFVRRQIRYAQFASYIEPLNDQLGSDAGKDGNLIRDDFVDTAAFIAGTADEYGTATVTFTMPHNLTSWRLTGVAYADNFIGTHNVPLAGHNTKNIQSGLPFFINQVMNTRYVSGDNIGITLRAAGTSVGGNDIVTYTVTLAGEGVNDTQTVYGFAGQVTPVVFAPLPPGVFTITTIAQFEDYFDGIALEIEVVDSLLLTQRRLSGSFLDGDISIAPHRFPVDVNLFDLDNSLFFGVAYRLLFSFGDRADSRIVRTLAADVLNDALGTDRYNAHRGITQSEMQGFGTQGVRLFPFMESETVLTAKAVVAAPHMFSEHNVTQYFTRVLNNAESGFIDSAAALMGLAAYRRPILMETRELFISSLERGNIAIEESLYLATALALLGDFEPALIWYNEVLSGFLSENRNGISFMYGESVLFNERMTAGTAVLATLLSHADYVGLMRHLLNSNSSFYLPVLELAVYLNRRVSSGYVTPSSLTYTLGGREINHIFTANRPLFLSLGETALHEANFSVSHGDVGFVVNYFGGLDGIYGFPKGISVETQLSESNINIGDRVIITTTITFAPGTDVGVYHIRQVVPSGLRFVDAWFVAYDNHIFPRQDARWRSYRIPNLGNAPIRFNEGESGVLNFHIGSASWLEGRMPTSVTFSFEARAILPGEYVVEATTLSLAGGETLYRGKRSVIVIE